MTQLNNKAAKIIKRMGELTTELNRLQVILQYELGNVDAEEKVVQSIDQNIPKESIPTLNTPIDHAHADDESFKIDTDVLKLIFYDKKQTVDNTLLDSIVEIQLVNKTIRVVKTSDEIDETAINVIRQLIKNNDFQMASKIVNGKRYYGYFLEAKKP